MNTFLLFFGLSSRARHAMRRLLVSVLFALPLCAPTHAQVTPAQERDMAIRHQQELLRQQQQEQQQRQRLEANKPDVRLDAGSPKPESMAGFPVESPCFVIQELRVRDADGRTPDALEWLERDWLRERQTSPVGQCIGAQGVARLLDHGQKVLTERGYVTTRLLVSPQDMSHGVLTLTLIPGRIRAVRFDPPLSERSSLGLALPMAPGQLLNLRDIEQALENFKRVPTADADIRIEPAQGPDARVGESDLLVLHRQGNRIRLNLSLDDGGTQATGKLLSTATGSLDNLFSANDLFYLTLNTDSGGGSPGPRNTHGKTAHYSFPVGYWTWGATWSESRYAQQVAGLNGSYMYSGTSESTEIKSSRLLFRDSVQKTKTKTVSKQAARSGIPPNL